MNPLNKYLDATMNEVATAAVQQVCDLAFYKRQTAGWTAGSYRTRPSPPCAGDHIRLARVPRPGREAGPRGACRGASRFAGDILMLVDGERILIKAPVKHNLDRRCPIESFDLHVS